MEKRGRKVTATMAVKMLQEKGVKVNEKEAENILDLMYFLAKLIVNQNFKK
jgi:hypothetical protein